MGSHPQKVKERPRHLHPVTWLDVIEADRNRRELARLVLVEDTAPLAEGGCAQSAGGRQ